MEPILAKMQVDAYNPAEWDELFASIMAHKENIAEAAPAHRIHFLRRNWVRYAAAAVLLFAVATTYILVKDKNTLITTAYNGDIAPGKEGARLKLSDGRIILLDSVKDGLIAMDGKMKVIKRNGKIMYEGSTDEIVYNEIFAERGRQSAPVVLPDGSIVWLNAASSIRYPLHFAGEVRLITMTGEVYFEVVHNEKQPFRVQVGDQVIEDIGTSFNVNAYNDEATIKTTLLEGIVKINATVLKPGEQYDNGKISSVNTEEVVAWKNGFFSVRDADIQTVMRQLARWYDVDVSYEGAIAKQTFTGKIDHNLSLGQVLNVLSDSKVHYRIEDAKHIVIIP